MSKLKVLGKLNPKQYSEMLGHLTRKKIKNPFIKAEDIVVNKKPEVEQREMFDRFNVANPRKDMAGGGMLVQPGFGGTRQGYADKKLSFRNQRILDIKNFVEDFKIKNERLPTRDEIKTKGKFDYQFIKDRVDAGDIQTLSTTEAKKLGRKKVDFEARTKKQKKTISKKQPFVLTDGPSQIVGKVSDVTFPNEEMKNNYLNDLRKIFAQKYRRTQYKDPGVLTTKQLAEKYFGKANDFTIAKIGKMNTFFADQLGLSFENLPIETKSAETAQRRRDRIVKARKELSPREKLINTQQDNLVNQINNYYRKFPDEVIKNEKLTNAILSRMNPDGTITLKTFNSFDEKNNYLKNIAKSDVGVMSIDHITDVKLEKKNVEFPINRQLAPTKTNQSVVTKAKNLIKNNIGKTDSANKNIVNNVIKSLNDLGLRVNIEGKVYGSELTPAIDVEKKILPNMQKSIDTFNLSTSASNFKINPSLFLTKGQRVVPPKSRPGQGGFIDRQLLTDAGKFLGRTAQAGFLTPTGVFATTAGLGGLDLTTPGGRLTLGAEAAFAPELVRASIGATKGIKNRALQKGIQQVLNLGLPTRLALRAARVASPIGIATLAGEGLYQAGKFSRDRIRELQAMTPEQRQQLRAEQSALAFEGARDGGLIGKKSGPPPISGPTPHGDEGLPAAFKNVRKR